MIILEMQQGRTFSKCLGNLTMLAMVSVGHIFICLCLFSEIINLGNIVPSKVFMAFAFMLEKETQIIPLQLFRGHSASKFHWPDRPKKEKISQKRIHIPKNGYYKSHRIKRFFSIDESIYSESVYCNLKHNLTAVGNHDLYTVNTKASKSQLHSTSWAKMAPYFSINFFIVNSLLVTFTYVM